MCLAKAYVDRNGKRGLLMEEIASLEIKDEKLLLETLFGEQKEIEDNREGYRASARKPQHGGD